MPKRLWAEFLGTLWLVFGGAGTAVLGATMVSGAGFPVGVGHLGVSLAFGLTVVTGAYALGHISGGHFNPAVTLGLAVAKRVEWAAVGPYIVAQILRWNDRRCAALRHHLWQGRLQRRRVRLRHQRLG